MQVKWKTPFVVIGLTLLFSVYGCTTSSTSSISGKLTLVSGANLFGLSSPVSDIPLFTLSSEKSPGGVKDPAFAPDEIIVKYKPGATPSPVTGAAGGVRYSVAREMRLPGRGTVQLLKMGTAGRSSSSEPRMREVTLREIERLNQLPDVEYAEPNYVYRVFSQPNDYYYGSDPRLWHYRLIKLDDFWEDASLDQIQDFSGIRVAVIDSGVVRKWEGLYWVDHPDLAGVFVDEYDFVDKDEDARDPGGSVATRSFHGTHVSGTIGALTNNGEDIAGVAGGNGSPGAGDAFNGVRIIPVRALNTEGNGYVYDIAQAILYASGAETHPDYKAGVIQKADVINMSFGGEANSQTMRDAINYAYYTKNVTLVASAGNYANRNPVYPAAYPEVISVAAVDIGADRAEYSSYGSTIDIAAPGGFGAMDIDFDSHPDGIFSTYFSSSENDFKLAYLTGTSMAAPHVSGVAAIVIRALQENPGTPEISPLTVKNILTSTAIDLGKPDFYGAGLLNAHAAASKAFGQAHPQLPVMFPFPKTIKLTGLESSGSFTLKNIGNGSPISVSTIKVGASDPSDLIENISPVTGLIGPNGLEVQVSFNIHGLRDGKTYSSRIDVTDSEGNTESVYALYKYIGSVYVVVFDAKTSEPVQVTRTSYEQDFEYSIDKLGDGEYFIGASTDRDNDGIVFEAEEAFGFFQSIENRVTIPLKSGISLVGVDFQILDGFL
jgi:serine protease